MTAFPDFQQAVLKNSGAACIWVSHDPTQPGRVGGRILSLPSGREAAVPPPEVDAKDVGNGALLEATD